MRFPDSRTIVPAALSLALAVVLPGNAARAGADPGSGSDYPVVLGEPFSVDGVTYTPADTINYDKVGVAEVAAGGTGISGASRTLPLPSYVEVTSLQSGRTILVRLDTRGPMSGDSLIALSPAAAAQLGGLEQGRLPVRVRRVNPPEAERAVLRTGQTAPLRIDTPPGLLAALNRKLAAQTAPPPPPAPPEPVATPDPAPTVEPAAPPAAKPVPTPPAPAKAPAKAAAKLKPEPKASAKPEPASKPEAKVPAAANGSYSVQLAAFSTRERAAAAATKVGGSVQPSGTFWRLRMGPFANRGQAEAALAKARAAGYTDARIQRAD